MSEFRINRYLTLKVEGVRTIIYVAGKRFIQCKFLLLNIPINKVKSLEELKSLDEITEKLDNTLEHPGEREDVYIDPRTEFWAHCSNLQVWYENNYDTRLLHRNLAFPLLHALTKAGDAIAKQVFKGEIATRLASGNDSVIKFLVSEHYVDFLDRDQYFMSILNPVEAESLLELEKFTDEPINQKVNWEEFDTGDGLDESQQFMVKDKSVIKLLLYWYNKPAKPLPSSVSNFKNLQVLRYFGDKIPSIPKTFVKLKNLQELSVESSILEEFPNSIFDLYKIEKLRIRSACLKFVPKRIGALNRLKLFSLGNMVEEIPDSIIELKRLEYLYLGNNLLTQIPVNVFLLRNLKTLHLQKNRIKKITESIGKLENLELLNLKGNKIRDLPKNLLNLKYLKTLFIDENNLTESGNLIIQKLKKKGIKIH